MARVGRAETDCRQMAASARAAAAAASARARRLAQTKQQWGMDTTQSLSPGLIAVLQSSK